MTKTNLHNVLLIGILSSVLLVAYYLLQSSRRHHKNDISLKINPYSAKQEPYCRFSYLLSRKRCAQNVFLLILVLSAPPNSDRRTVIRRTWGNDRSVQMRWKTVFLVGQALGSNSQSENIDAESTIYGDVIRGSHIDHYHNLTLKTQMGLEWASGYCDFNYLLKVDDDVFVNPYNLLDHLGKPDTQVTNLYMGRCFFNGTVLRVGKHGVTTKEYSASTYPAYCNGPAYLLSSDLVHKLVELFDTYIPFRLEDVYIGILIHEIGGVEALGHSGFRTQQFSEPCKHFPNMFAYHEASVKCLEELFEEGIKERLELEFSKLGNVTG